MSEPSLLRAERLCRSYQSGADTITVLREADLLGHLENDKGAEEAAKAAKTAAKADGTPVEDEAAEPVRFELAGENDHQLKQAIRLLKGEDIAQAVQAAAAEAAGDKAAAVEAAQPAAAKQ